MRKFLFVAVKCVVHSGSRWAKDIIPAPLLYAGNRTCKYSCKQPHCVTTVPMGCVTLVSMVNISCLQYIENYT